MDFEVNFNNSFFWNVKPYSLLHVYNRLLLDLKKFAKFAPSFQRSWINYKSY